MVDDEAVRATYLPMKEDFIYWDDPENDIHIFLLAQEADPRELQFDPDTGEISEKK